MILHEANPSRSRSRLKRRTSQAGRIHRVVGTPRIFRSFFLGGFECSTHIRRDGRRLDLLRATRHSEFAESDYLLLQRHGIYSAREGLCWHLIERQPGQYDFSSAAPLLRAACSVGTQVIWDLWHYGWPDGLDIFSAEFIERFVAYAKAAAAFLADASDELFLCPVNEISFFSFAGGEAGFMFPFARGRGDEVKRQLVSASIQAIRAMRADHPRLRICHVDPVINIVPDHPSAKGPNAAGAEAFHESQFEACDMMLGRAAPELGGSYDLVDFLGLNYYIHNQRSQSGSIIMPSDPRYRPFRDLVRENHRRYGKPLFLAETGIEDEGRPAWLRYIGNEVFAVEEDGIPVHGICLYPILNHPGWDDERHCHNGLLGYADAEGRRQIYSPLANELAQQQRFRAKSTRRNKTLSDDRHDTPGADLDQAANVMESRTEISRGSGEPVQAFTHEGLSDEDTSTAALWSGRDVR